MMEIDNELLKSVSKYMSLVLRHKLGNLKLSGGGRLRLQRCFFFLGEKNG